MLRPKSYKTGKKRNKTLSERVNEVFDDTTDNINHQVDAPVLEDDFADDYKNDEKVKSAIFSKVPHNKKSSSSPLTGILRKRASLDDGYSTGQYAAELVNTADVERKMDALFGMLDEDDGDLDVYENLEESDYGNKDELEKYRDNENKGTEEKILKRKEEIGGKKSKSLDNKKMLKKRKRVETEEEFASILEKKMLLKPVKKFREDGSSIRPKGAYDRDEDDEIEKIIVGNVEASNTTEADMLKQLEELRKRQAAMQVIAGDDQRMIQNAEDISAVGTSGSLSSAASGEKIESHAKTVGDLVLERIKIFSSLLGLRVRLQPCVNLAAQFPQHDIYKTYANYIDRKTATKEKRNDDDDQEENETDRQNGGVNFEKITTQTKGILCELISFAAKMGGVKKTHRVVVPSQGEHATSNALLDVIDKHHESVIKIVDATLEYWGNKTMANTTGKSALLQSINQPLLDQIKAIISSQARLLNKVQRNRSHIPPFGKEELIEAMSPIERAALIAAGDFDVEIFDDADFIRELVHRYGSTSQKEIEGAMVKATTITATSGKSNGGQNGNSKSNNRRKISFHPHTKLVGFMAPVPWEEDKAKQHEALLNSLFQ